jgi:hypothetical protein
MESDRGQGRSLRRGLGQGGPQFARTATSTLDDLRDDGAYAIKRLTSAAVINDGAGYRSQRETIDDDRLWKLSRAFDGDEMVGRALRAVRNQGMDPPRDPGADPMLAQRR